MPSLILKTATRLLVGLILSFAAALVAGTGFALFAIAEGPTVVRRAIRVAPQKIAMGGLGLAIVSGLAAPLIGRPFLTGTWWIWQNGQTQQLAIGTPLFFDVGVFFAVLGTILTLILALEEN